jgi:hypothetical protein
VLNRDKAITSCPGFFTCLVKKPVIIPKKRAVHIKINNFEKLAEKFVLAIHDDAS